MLVLLHSEKPITGACGGAIRRPISIVGHARSDRATGFLRQRAERRPDLSPTVTNMSAPKLRGSIVSTQTSTLIGLKLGIKIIAAVHSQCRRWVTNGPKAESAMSPLLLNQQTLVGTFLMPLPCQDRT
jgi:hypothetical protein